MKFTGSSWAFFGKDTGSYPQILTVGFFEKVGFPQDIFKIRLMFGIIYSGGLGNYG